MPSEFREYATTERNIPDHIGEMIDQRVHHHLKQTHHGMAQVALSGFGKGVLLTAAAVIAATVIGAVIAPTAVLGAAYATASADALLATGLATAGKFLLGGGGIMTLLAGGTFGSLAAAHTENKDISAEIAAERAEFYKKLREKKITPAEIEAILEPEQATQRGAHSENILKERASQLEQMSAQR